MNFHSIVTVLYFYWVLRGNILRKGEEDQQKGARGESSSEAPDRPKARHHGDGWDTQQSKGPPKEAIWSPERGGENTKSGLPRPLNVGDNVTHNDYLEKG